MTDTENRKEYLNNVKEGCLNIMSCEDIPVERKIKAISKFLKHAHRMFLELPTSMLNPKSLSAVEDYFSGCGKVGCQFYDNPNAALSLAGKVIQENFLPDGALGRFVLAAEKLLRDDDRTAKYEGASKAFSEMCSNWENTFSKFFRDYISKIKFADPLYEDISFLHYRASIDVAYTILRVLAVCGCRSVDDLNFLCTEMSSALEHEDWLNAAVDILEEAHQALSKRTNSGKQE